MIKLILLVCLGGAAGSLLRFGANEVLAKHYPSNYPVATFVVNMAGCFLIGIFYALSEKYGWFDAQWRVLLITGFCGGLTTFSAFAYENLRLIQQGNYFLFVAYSLGSIVLSLLALVGAICLAKAFLG